LNPLSYVRILIPTTDRSKLKAKGAASDQAGKARAELAPGTSNF